MTKQIRTTNMIVYFMNVALIADFDESDFGFALAGFHKSTGGLGHFGLTRDFSGACAQASHPSP